MRSGSFQKPSPSGLIEVRYVYSPQFPQILEHLRASVLATTYQAGKLLVIGSKNRELDISFIDFEQPMGLAVSPSRIAIGTRRQIHFLTPAHETQRGSQSHDGCFVPRWSFYTGSILGHDMGWGNDELWITNTLFSCLSTLHDDFSFVPQWRPPFISQLIDQDRCHLNGMAMELGHPRFVTALAGSNTPAGWREVKANSGIIIDVQSSEVVCRNLSMPHSPRIYQNRLWVLDSGNGSFGFVNLETGRFSAVEQMPGYTRGLSFCGQFAFVGLSKIRETAVFSGVPIAEKHNELRCGIGVVDLATCQTVATLQFLAGVNEIFSVEILPGFINPLIAGSIHEQQEREVWILPNENQPRPESDRRLAIFSLNSARQSIRETVAPQMPDRLLTQSRQQKLKGQANNAAPTPEQEILLSCDAASSLVDLGNSRQNLGNQHSALLCYERAIEADPNCIAALQNLGYLLFNLGEAEKARDIYDRLLLLEPSTLNLLLASSVLPVVYDSNSDMDYWRKRQIGILRKAVSMGDKVDATKSLVPTCFFAAYQGLCDRELMKLRNQVIEGNDFSKPKVDFVRSKKRIRVGVLSAYFRDHTVGRLNIGRLEGLSREYIHLSVVYAGSLMDDFVERYRSAADEFVNLPRNLASAIAVLKSLSLDILIHADVGMDSLTQTLAYSRFAPVQIATWGHPDTTGSSMIDYFLSSDQLETKGSQTSYSEKLLKMPSLGIDYERPVLGVDAKSRLQLGLPTDSRLYGCPQSLFKFHPEFDILLATILEADDKGQLVLIEGRIPQWTHQLQRRFRRTLPEAGRRVRFIPAISRNDFISLLGVVDVLLDPIHFGGGNSSIESLALGTPLVTLPGSFLRSRITSALYSELGLTEMIATNADHYCKLAVLIANDLVYQRELRKKISAASAVFFEKPRASRQLEDCLLGLTN